MDSISSAPVQATANYKALKEAFVSNLNGGSISEINAVTCVLPSAIFLWSALQSRKNFFQPYTILAGLTDWLITCVSVLFGLTIYSSRPILLNLFLLAPALMLLLFPESPLAATQNARPRASKTLRGSTSSDKTKPNQSSTLSPLPIKPFVTMYRGSMMVITCAAILAVDFRVFPRRFAKVETWGTSLMDLGVGSFVFSAGVVAARSVLKRSPSHGTLPPLFHRLTTSTLVHSLPLLALGLVRLWSVKKVDYAEHVTEYGVHWNFFFTLGLLPPFAAVFQSLYALVPSYHVLALGVAAAYEAVLDFTDLTAYIVAAPRDHGFFSQNREGACSFAGYLAVFLAGQAAGCYVLPREAHPGSSHAQKTEGKPPPTLARRAVLFLRHDALGKLLLAGTLWTFVFHLSTAYPLGLNLRVSRRLANLPYAAWVASFNHFMLAACLGTERLFFPHPHDDSSPTSSSTSSSSSSAAAAAESSRVARATSPLLAAVNRNGLAVFLVANLLTGAVNLALPTLDLGAAPSVGVLLVYMGVLGGVAVALDRKGVVVKL